MQSLCPSNCQPVPLIHPEKNSPSCPETYFSQESFFHVYLYLCLHSLQNCIKAANIKANTLGVKSSEVLMYVRLTYKEFRVLTCISQQSFKLNNLITLILHL